jgi:hypothetical protein
MQKLPCKYGLSDLLKVEAVAFEKGGQLRLGFDPEELREIIPELVVELPNGLLVVDNGAMTAVLLNALKELAPKTETKVSAAQKVKK